MRAQVGRHSPLLGRNEEGEIGDGTWVSKATPTSPNGLSGISSIANGSRNTCALMSDNSLKCWGANAQHQTGQVTENGWHVLEPAMVAGFVRAGGGAGNDSIGTPQALSVPFADSIDTDDLTSEASDPLPSCHAGDPLAHTAWYVHTPAFSHLLQLTSGPDTVLSVYDGPTTSLAERACLGPGSSGQVAVTAHVTYHLLAGAEIGSDELSFATIRETTPPTDPVLDSDTHPANQWSNGHFLHVSWAGAADAESGVRGYSYVLDNSPLTVPDTTIDYNATAGEASVVNPSSLTYYAHLRTVDNFGNWSGGVHYGPMLVDVAQAWNPPDLASTSHELGVPSNDPTIDISWSAANDPGGSPQVGYSFSWVTSWPDEVVDVDASTLSTSSDAMADGGWKWFYIRGIDAAGNLGSVASLGPFVIDTAAPSATVDSGPAAGSTITDPRPTFEFSAPEDSTFECRIDGASYGPCTSPMQLAPLGNGPHTFQVRATDTAGNLGTAVSRSFSVNTAGPGKADGHIRKANESTFIGNNVYSSSGAGQTKSAMAARRKSKTFVIRLQNDASFADRLLVSGPGTSSPAYTVKYFAGASGSTDITAQVLAGTYTTNQVAAGGTRTIRVVISVKPSAAHGAAFGVLVVVRSQSNATSTDSVNAEVTVK